MFARALYELRDGSRDASGRALAFRGLRALKFAASLRRTFPFFRLFGDRRRRCNTGTGSAALKSPDYYIRAALNAALRRTVLCRAVLCRMRGPIRACTYVNPMALTSFPAARPASLVLAQRTREQRTYTSWQGVAIQNGLAYKHKDARPISSMNNERETSFDFFRFIWKISCRDATNYIFFGKRREIERQYCIRG